MNHNKQGQTAAGGIMKGALAGMAIGAAAVVLSKKENRKKVQSKMTELLEMGEDRIDQTKGALTDLQKNAKKKVSKQIDKVSDRLNEVDSKKTS